MTQQPGACKEHACEFCRHNKHRLVCQTFPILKNCFKQGPPYPKPDPLWEIDSTSANNPGQQQQQQQFDRSPKKVTFNADRAPPRGCTFHTKNGMLNIAARDFPVRGHFWKRTSDGGVVWKEGGGLKIDHEGTGDPFCVPFKPDRDGLFYFTAISSAPHSSEHNDVWFKFTSKVKIYRPTTGSVQRRSGWIKGYENEGNNKKADYVLTVDHKGYQFFLEGLQKGAVYKVCASGRSTRFKLFNFVFMHCDSLKSCVRWNNYVRNAMAHLPPPAKCM